MWLPLLLVLAAAVHALITTNETSTTISIANDRLDVRLSKASGAITYIHLDGVDLLGKGGTTYLGRRVSSTFFFHVLTPPCRLLLHSLRSLHPRLYSTHVPARDLPSFSLSRLCWNYPHRNISSHFPNLPTALVPPRSRNRSPRFLSPSLSQHHRAVTTKFARIPHFV